MKAYTDKELQFAKAYFNYHNGEIHANYEDYTFYKSVCEKIKQEHKFNNWQQVNQFLEGEPDYEALTAKYTR